MKISTQRLILCFYVVSLHVIVVYVQGDWLIKCGGCKCKWNSGKKTADCKNISLDSVPEYLSSELQVLDLSFNQVAVITEDAFLKADLQNLHKLFMRNCSLETIVPNGLRGLEILIELDLSSNLIQTLSEEVFVSLVKVRSLILNNNVLESLEDGLFRNLKYLRKIELQENRIASIGTDVFINVPLLSQIFLTGNRLNFLRKETFEKLKRLASLSLELNPWNCTCELQAFRDFVLNRNLYTPPTSCHNPPQLRGMLWTDNQPEAFACKPRIIYPSRGASINTSKENVTLICRVHASPNTLIVWDYNKQVYSGNLHTRVHIQMLREETASEKEVGRDVYISRLTIVGAEKSDEGVYTCVAENAGGKDEVQMSLLVQKHNHQSILIQNNLIIVICLMVLGLLSASIFLAMVTCCIYKRFRAINHRAAEEQQLQQKRNFGGLNVVNAVNESYHAGPTGDTNYVEIKQTKVQSGGLANGGVGEVVGSINNFTHLNDSRGLYHENSNQGSVPHQSIQIDTTALPGRHKALDQSGEYQPDLLPYIPQSISFNNSGLYNHSSTVVNSAGLCDNQPMTYHHRQQQQLQQHHHHPQLYPQDKQDYQLQHHQHQQQQEQSNDQIVDDDLEYTNNFLQSNHNGQHQLHYGIIELPNNAKSMLAPSNSSMATLNRTAPYEDTSLPLDHHVLPRQSIVRTSPSLNFLSNYYHRRELL